MVTINTDKSSQTKQVAFDKEKNIMYVTFRSNGSTYVYSPVTAKQFDKLIEASSIGSHLHKNFNKKTPGLDIRIKK
jgi:hypothetical protein